MNLTEKARVALKSGDPKKWCDLLQATLVNPGDLWVTSTATTSGDLADLLLHQTYATLFEKAMYDRSRIPEEWCGIEAVTLRQQGLMASAVMCLKSVFELGDSRPTPTARRGATQKKVRQELPPQQPRERRGSSGGWSELLDLLADPPSSRIGKN